MTIPAVGNVTLLLRQWRSGDGPSMDRLMTLIYPELRRLARRQLRDERPNHLLQPTALVNEAYLRLVSHESHTWENRSHFYGAAAQLMRRILIDHARAQRARKRNGDHAATPIDEEVVFSETSSIDLLALDEALTHLEKLSPRQVRIVELRYFAGSSVPEVAAALGMNARTVDRDWAAARAWLRHRLYS
jgi:RNA polymerase sigma-70 factor (ECF subfamily)